MLKKIHTNYKIYRKELREKGLIYVIFARLRKITDMLSFIYYKTFLSSCTFLFNNNSYPYYFHRYNFTWRNERVVEIPIFKEIIDRFKNKKILEVGNVLSHYYFVSHDILDKYEKAKNVINEDVVSFKPYNKKYDLIISISTLEHVGWDEKREKMKIVRALHNLKSLLAKKGRIVVSLPLGIPNPDVNIVLKNYKKYFTNTYYLKRISKRNIWKQVNKSQIKNSTYNSLFPNANEIVIGFFQS